MQTHQELGTKLKLFFQHEHSPGSIFWTPKGALIYNRLIKYIRTLYEEYEYQEVVSPNIFDKKLWITSGHWDNYKENMFIIEQGNHKEDNNDNNDNPDQDNLEHNHSNDNQKHFSLKPMNCGGHCLIFENMRPTYKDLPIRMAEFGVLHRNEFSGALNGLLRVRRFQQDDSHIFCAMEHLQDEIFNVLQMIDRTYGLFNIKYKIYLSTRPDKYIGNINIWDKSEEILKSVIQKFLGKDKINIKEGDGAFYGPKIDIALLDRHKRENQCGTIQLDFNLPSENRFNLKYPDNDQTLKHPIIIHRAILGSIERFVAIILEHTQGRLPFWLSPYQIGICTIHKDYNYHAIELKKRIKSILKDKVQIEVDTSTEDIRNKIKYMEKLKYNFIIGIGQKEVEKDIYTLRIDGKRCEFTFDEMINIFSGNLEFI